MNCCKEPYCDSSKTLKLIRPQVNLIPRLDKATLEFDDMNSRPCSAAPHFRPQIKHMTKCVRPRSADCCSLNPSSQESLQRLFNFNQNKMFENKSLTVSHFTDSSSKLLQNLTDTSKPGTLVIEYNNFKTEKFSQAPEDHESEVERTQNELENRNEVSVADVTDDLELHKSFKKYNVWAKKHSNIKNSGIHSKLSDVSENKAVRFLERHELEPFCEKKFNLQEKYAFCSDNKNCFSFLKDEIKPLKEEIHTCQKCCKSSEGTKVLELKTQRTDTDGKKESDEFLFGLKRFYSDNKALKDKEESEVQMFGEKRRNSPKYHKILNKSIENQKKNLELSAFQSNAEMKNAETKNEFKETVIQLTCTSDEETNKENGKFVEVKEKIENIGIHNGDSTYEEIVSVLQILDEEDPESLCSENKEDATGTAITLGSIEGKIDDICAVSSYLEKVERDSDGLLENYSNPEKWKPTSFASPRLEELLNKNSVELAHEVFSLKIQVEDQKKGIKLLRKTLAEMKEEKKVEKIEQQEVLNKVTSEAEVLVQRHQKFIKQLLNEKKNLNETVSKLVQDLKSGEERYKRNLKAMEEKHSIEIKRAKEAQMVAEKIKRQKWMENKTQKIKEMTIKGLEPELSRMAIHQQEEITELRNLHKAELQAIELRAARRNSELMDELRAELTKEKERAITKETAALRDAMTKDFETEKSSLQQCCQNLKDRIRKQEEKLSNQELEFQQRLIDYKQEEEKKKQKMIRDHQENLEEVRRQHLIELRHLKELMETEKEAFLNNYKKQQAAKSLEREAELHQQYKKERDEEIELAIETLEKESAKIQSEQNAANEGKLKRLKDNMEAEIKEIEASEAALKVKLSEIKTKLSEKEDIITELNSQIRQLQAELTFVKKTCEEMSMEKAKLKEVIREEFENSLSNSAQEKEHLEKEIVNLKEFHLKELTNKDQQNFQAKLEMQKELARVYSRIKTAVNKKERIIKCLREENEIINQKCCQLEIMLDQQRRNLLL